MLVQFGVLLSSLSSLCMRLQGWDFETPPHCTDLAKDYIAAFYLNWSDDEKRTRRELINMAATDDENVIGKDGVELESPSFTGAIVPPVPAELHEHHPRMWCCPDSAQSPLEKGQDPETLPSAFAGG